MKALPWVLVAALVAWAVLSGRNVGEAVGRAEVAEDSVAVLRGVLGGLHARDSTQSDALRGLQDSLAIERGARAAQRDTARLAVVQARQAGTAALDSARLTATVEVASWIAAHELQDSVAFAGLASQIASLEADTVAFHVELAATVNLLAIARTGWDVAELALDQATLRGDAFEQAYRASQRGKWTERVAVVVAVAGVLLLR